MKKLMSAVAVCGALFVGACDRNTGAQNGDTVVIDYAGYLDGVQFPGGTAEKFPLKLGSGQFVPGFEDQLVGTNVGEQVDVNITFPENYVPGLAGKDVVFKVTVHEIIKAEPATVDSEAPAAPAETPAEPAAEAPVEAQ